MTDFRMNQISFHTAAWIVTLRKKYLEHVSDVDLISEAVDLAVDTVDAIEAVTKQRFE